MIHLKLRQGSKECLASLRQSALFLGKSPNLKGKDQSLTLILTPWLLVEEKVLNSMAS